MAGQEYVGAAGDSTHAYTVTPIIEKTIDALSQRSSILGGLGWDSSGRERKVNTKELGGAEHDIGNASVIQVKEINVGDEARFTLGMDLKGRLTHGRAPVAQGQYQEFLHDNVRLNLADSPEFQLWAEMDRQRFGNVISDMDAYTQQKIAEYMGTWIDLLGIQSLLHGADEGLLLTSDGGLGMTLWNAPSAGYVCSCKNTYVGGSGMVSWNATRATFEAAIGSAIYGLTDTTGDGFSLAAHEVILNQLISVLRFKTAEAFGRQLRAIALADPWLVRRILERNSNNTWYTLLKDADMRGMEKNHMIDRDQSVIIDKILYIPCDWLRAFRATGDDAEQPTYGAGLTEDPQVYIETADTSSKKCPIIYMGAKALLCAKSSKQYVIGKNRVQRGKIWITERMGAHEKGGGLSAHTKCGFKRYEPSSKTGGTVTYHNDGTLVAWFYDPGPGVSFAA